MGKLSELEKRELLEDAASLARRKDFQRLRETSRSTKLELSEYLEFLNWAQRISTGETLPRKPISGSRFLL